jgi:hypothetical protein
VLIVLLASALIAVGARLLDRRPEIPAQLISAGALSLTVRGPSITTLPDGRLLVLGQGGGSDRFVMTFDPATGTSSEGFDIGDPFAQSPQVEALPDGRVLLLGRLLTEPDESGHAALGWLDPATGTVSVAARMMTSRFAAIPTVLPDGRVMVSGGADTSTSLGPLASVEVFLPDPGAFASLAPMLQPRFRHATVLLDDGRVLIVGGQGNNGDVLEIELYDPDAWTSTVVGRLAEPQWIIAAPPIRLADGTILIPGGPIDPNPCGEHQPTRQSMYRFDPATERLAPLAPLPHFVINALALSDGRALVFGSYPSFPSDCDKTTSPILTRWLGVYDPDTGVTVETMDPATGIGGLDVQVTREYSSAALLQDGRVALIADDSDNPVPNVVDILTMQP